MKTQISVQKFMEKLNRICEGRFDNSYIDYTADEDFGLDKLVSVILFGADLETGESIKGVIEDELYQYIDEISITKDDDGFAWSYQANIGIYIRFNESVCPSDEDYFLYNPNYQLD